MLVGGVLKNGPKFDIGRSVAEPLRRVGTPKNQGKNQAKKEFLDRFWVVG